MAFIVSHLTEDKASTRFPTALQIFSPIEQRVRFFFEGLSESVKAQTTATDLPKEDKRRSEQDQE